MPATCSPPPPVYLPRTRHQPSKGEGAPHTPSQPPHAPLQLPPFRPTTPHHTWPAPAPARSDPLPPLPPTTTPAPGLPPHLPAALPPPHPPTTTPGLPPHLPAAPPPAPPPAWRLVYPRTCQRALLLEDVGYEGAGPVEALRQQGRGEHGEGEQPGQQVGEQPVEDQQGDAQREQQLVEAGHRHTRSTPAPAPYGYGPGPPRPLELSPLRHLRHYRGAGRSEVVPGGAFPWTLDPGAWCLVSRALCFSGPESWRRGAWSRRGRVRGCRAAAPGLPVAACGPASDGAEGRRVQVGPKNACGYLRGAGAGHHCKGFFKAVFLDQ